MKIALLTPRSASRLAGNQTTAERWQAHLRDLGHAASVVHGLAEVDADAASGANDWLIALHAWRSAEAILEWKQTRSDRPLTLMLTGTDLYQFQLSHPAICHRSMELADHLVGLHEQVGRVIPERFHPKLRIIRQSSPWIEDRLCQASAAPGGHTGPDVSPLGRAESADQPFTVLVSGHLRHEKDSLRAALAVRDLPTASRLRVRQAGQAHDAEWAALATAEMRTNPRYTWLGELSREALFEELQAARVLVMPSRMEGGANAVSECILLGLPLIASRIDGNTGLLGEDYPALFEVEDTAGLRALLLRAEHDPAWLGELSAWLRRLRPAFTTASEREGIRRLVAEVRAIRPAGTDITTLEELARRADYSLMDRLNRDPKADPEGNDHDPREVRQGHYVTVRPTPIEAPEYVVHSEPLFRELGLADSLAQSADFMRVFSGDLAQVPSPMRRVGWACGYALSIYGTEYTQQCPFRTGNGYGDGRAISVFEAVLGGRRREMQLKGGGRTPYCRGADGRAVLRSSVREFLAQEHMHALGLPTSRSLSLYASKTERVMRPWYVEGSRSWDPDRLISEPVAISTRVASSFIRVGQLELFGRRARKEEYPGALQELEQLVRHLIDREYGESIDPNLDLPTQVVLLAQAFRGRLVRLVANWIRVGYCQGNFNSDNCAAGGFTLDYGPFGFCDVFDPAYQPWTGGGDHFAFLNQPVAAQRNFRMFCLALQPLLDTHRDHRARLEEIQRDFPQAMQAEMQSMWAAKLGLEAFDADLVNELLILMSRTPVDYTLFFRELAALPDDVDALQKAFYRLPQAPSTGDAGEMDRRWSTWLTRWRSCLGIGETNRGAEAQAQRREACSRRMKRVNPKYILREWLMIPVYQEAAQGNYAPLRELQAVMAHPYDEQSCEVEQRFYRQKSLALFALGGVSHYSCSS